LVPSSLSAFCVSAFYERHGRVTLYWRIEWNGVTVSGLEHATENVSGFLSFDVVMVLEV
jgi:hypothetical protein